MFEKASDTQTLSAERTAENRFTILERRHSTPLLDHFVVADDEKTREMHLAAAWVSDDPSFRDAFRYLAPSFSQLTHAALNPILEGGVLDGRLYTLTPMRTGIPLIRILRAQPRGTTLSLSAFVYVLRTALSALNAIHTLRDLSHSPVHILHHDIDVESVLLRPDGSLELAFNFPWLSTWAQRRRYRIIDTTLGTAMPPELLVAGPVDLRADLYSIATQVTALWGEAYRRTDRHFTREARLESLAQITEASPALGELFKVAMRTEASLRHASAGVMLDYLDKNAPPAEPAASAELTKLAQTSHAKQLFESFNERIERVHGPARHTHLPMANQPAAELETRAYASRKSSTVNLPLSEFPAVSAFRDATRTPRPQLPTIDESVGIVLDGSEELFDIEPPLAGFSSPDELPHEETRKATHAPSISLLEGAPLERPTAAVLPPPRHRHPHPEVSALSDSIRDLDRHESVGPLRAAARSRLAGNPTRALNILYGFEATMPQSAVGAHRVEVLMALVEAGLAAEAVKMISELDALRFSRRDRTLINYYLGLAAFALENDALASSRFGAIPLELAHRYPDLRELLKLTQVESA